MRRARLFWCGVTVAIIALGVGAVKRHHGLCRSLLRANSKAVECTLPEQAPVSAPRLVVIHKAERALGLYLDGHLTSTYRIALGPNPAGPKQREGDGRTPEGTYYICTRNPNSRFYLFLGISYPNTPDAEAALRAGLITQDQHDAIVHADRSRQRPPWDTPLGGEIGIHGNGSARDWTAGCIALEDEQVEGLWEVLRVGDPVVIEP